MEIKFPKTMGESIDLYYTSREERLKLERSVKEMKTKEAALKDYIIQTFGEADLNGAKGKIAIASVTETVIPIVQNWDALYKHIRKTGEFDLLERRVGRLAFRERYESGLIVPGVDPFKEVDLSVQKASRK